MGKKRRCYSYSNEFRALALERMKGCENVTALAAELGIERSLLYLWRKQAGKQGREGSEPRGEESRESRLSRENQQLKLLLAEKVQELDFFRGALQRIEARRQQSGQTGAQTSTRKSGE